MHLQKKPRKSVSKAPLFPHLNFKASSVSPNLSPERTSATPLRNEVRRSSLFLRCSKLSTNCCQLPSVSVFVVPSPLQYMDFFLHIFFNCGERTHTQRETPLPSWRGGAFCHCHVLLGLCWRRENTISFMHVVIVFPPLLWKQASEPTRVSERRAALFHHVQLCEMRALVMWPIVCVCEGNITARLEVRCCAKWTLAVFF